MTSTDNGSQPREFRIERPGGSLGVIDLTDGNPSQDAPVVIAVHGITANGLSWLCVAQELSSRRGPGSVRFLAPDLRGRADSRTMSGPYGLGAHADDVLAIAESLGTRPVLVGHSMGAFVTALASARAPERVAGSVLVDGGFAFPPPAAFDIDAALTAVLGPAMARLSMRFESPEAYLDFWRPHPALGPALNGPRAAEVERYALHDLVRTEDGDWVSSCVLDAVRADGAGVLADPEAHAGAVTAAGAGVPTEFLWAPRGLQNEAQGLYDEGRIAALALPPQIRVTPIPDVNHYTAAFDPNGVTAVVDAIERRLDAE